MAGVNIVGHLHALSSTLQHDDIEVDLGDGTYLHGAQVMPGISAGRGGWVVGSVESFKIVGEDGFVISGVYGESDEPHMTVDDDDTGDGKEMSEGDGEEDEEEEDVSKKYSKPPRPLPTSYMSLSPPLALQDAAFFKVLAVKGSEVEVFIRSYTSNGRQFWSTPIEGGGIRGNIAIAYGANDDVGKLLLYSGSGIKSFSPKTGKQTDFFPLSLEVLEDVHLTVREGYIYGCGESGIFRVKIGGGGEWVKEVRGHCSQPPTVAKGSDGKVYWTVTMAGNGETSAVGVWIVRDDELLESRNVKCKSGVAGNGVWIRRGEIDSKKDSMGDVNKTEGGGKKLRSKGSGKDRTKGESKDNWGGLALVLTISQTLHIVNPKCPSDYSTPMGGHVESQPVATTTAAGTEVVVGTMKGDVVGWGFEGGWEPASTFQFQEVEGGDGTRVRVNIQGSGLVDTGSVKMRITEGEGLVELSSKPVKGSLAVSFAQDGGGVEVASKVLVAEEEGSVDIGIVIGAIIFGVALSVLFS